MIETLWAQRGNILLVAFLLYCYHRAPRMVPYAAKAARFAIACAFLTVFALAYRRFNGAHGWSLDQSAFATALNIAGVFGMIVAIGAAGVAIILDTRRRRR